MSNHRYKQISFKNDKGFTLIELLIVIVIVGILAAVAVPAYTQHITNAKAAEALVNMQAIIEYVTAYIQSHPNSWKDSDGLLGNNVYTSDTGDNWIKSVVGNNRYFDYGWNPGSRRIIALGRAEPFTASDQLCTYFYSGNGRFLNEWLASGKLKTIKPTSWYE